MVTRFSSRYYIITTTEAISQ